MEEKVVKPISNPTKSLPTVELKPNQANQLTDIPNIKKEEAIDPLIPSEDYKTSPLWHEVVSYLGIPEQEWDGAKNDVSVIVDYIIKNINSNDPDQVVYTLRQLEDILERPSWGEKRYKILYRYIRLASKRQSISTAMKAFERGGVL